jgi:hypothetical protein
MPENEQGEDELVPNARAQERPILVVLQGAELQTTLICQPTQNFFISTQNSTHPDTTRFLLCPEQQWDDNRAQETLRAGTADPQAVF